MLGEGRGRWAVSKKPKLVRNSYIHHFINVIIKVNMQKRLFKEQRNLLDTKNFTGLDMMHLQIFV